MKLNIPTLLFAAALCSTAAAEIPRTADGRPDLSGNYDLATLTPLERPREFGNNLYLSPEEAERAMAAVKERLARLEATKNNDPDREAPPAGGDGILDFGAGGVGGYNTFWVDRGEDGFEIDGKFRTSIIYAPDNGRRPPMTPAGLQLMQERFGSYRKPNTGTAWWLA
ncbi:MAG: hypothetical protein HKN19_17520, partial [Halioglobus sp.]|nr:hypothetical protein [Halioglobus sp.]